MNNQLWKHNFDVITAYSKGHPDVPTLGEECVVREEREKFEEINFNIMTRRGGCCMYINLIMAAFGCLGGLSGFVIFFFHFQNRQAGIWAFVGGMYAAMTLFLHILYKRHSLELWYTPGNLSQIRLFGILGTLAGIAAICSYFGIAVENHEDLPWRENLSTSHYIMGCWAFLTLKWAISLAGFAHHYRKRGMAE
ncbi:heme transporter HRG1-like isoform X2 [Oratosquilla oratoria]|uniref:heme transporter HRG1-like isoform X2 n=1 Tax=Oratosquilla oratoria TaxID=337810 RepID=UPI003F7681AF